MNENVRNYLEINSEEIVKIKTNKLERDNNEGVGASIGVPMMGMSLYRMAIISK